MQRKEEQKEEKRKIVISKPEVAEKKGVIRQRDENKRRNFGLKTDLDKDVGPTKKETLFLPVPHVWLIVSMVSLEWSALLLLVVFDVVAVEMEEKSRFRSLKTAPEESTVAVRGSPSTVSRVLMVVVS